MEKTAASCCRLKLYLSPSSCTESARTFNLLCCQFSSFSPSVPPPVLSHRSCPEPGTPHSMSFSQTEWVNCGLINRNCDCLISCSGLNVRCPTSTDRLMCSNTCSSTGDAVWESRGHYRRGASQGGVCHMGQALTLTGLASLFTLCVLSVGVVWPASFLLLTPRCPCLLLCLPCQDAMYLSGTVIKIIPPFSFRLLSSGYFHHSYRKARQQQSLVCTYESSVPQKILGLLCGPRKDTLCFDCSLV